MRLRFRRLVGSTGLMLCFPAALFSLSATMAHAGTLYCVTVEAFTLPCSPNSSTPVTGSPSPGFQNGSANAAAGETADGRLALGSLRAAAGANASAGESDVGFGAGETSAAFSGDEVVFSGPNGGVTLTSLNLTLNGALVVDGSGTGSWGGSTTVAVNTNLQGSQGSVAGTGSLSAKAATGSALAITSSGLLAGFTSPSGSFSTPTISIVNGDHVLVDLSLVVNSSCSASGPVGFPFHQGIGSCNAGADYLDTPFGFGFSQSGPVFNLPAGWTANALDGSVVNNMLVPEPSTWVLVAVSLIGLAAARRLGLTA